MKSQSDGTPAGAFDKLLILVGIIGAAVSILAVLVVINGDGDDSGDREAADETGTVQTAHFELTEFEIIGDDTVGSGPTRFEVHNSGAATHNLVLEGRPSTPDLSNGESAVLDIGELEPGVYTPFCSISGHREAGMETTISVEQGAEASGGAHEDHGDEVDWDALDDAMTQSILAFPAETEDKGDQKLAPTILADGTKEFHLTAAIKPWEVEPGKIVDAWTYNEQVPGPVIEVDLGDKVRVVVDNQLPMGTDIHWHGVRTPNDQDGVAPLTQDLIKSGETFVYEFEAINPAIGMYHAHHHGHVQIPNGMFGVFIIGDTPLPRGRTISGIEIPQDLEVTQEIPMVLNDAGVIGLSLNGKSFPATEP